MPFNFALEKDLEDIIYEKRGVIHEKGFEVFLSNTYKQYRLPSGKEIDLLTFEHDEESILFYVIELKKDKTTEQTLLQAYGYLDELLKYLSLKYKYLDFKVIIVGRKVSDMPIAKYLSVSTESYEYDYGLDGFTFEMKTNNHNYINCIHKDSKRIKNTQNYRYGANPDLLKEIEGKLLSKD